VLKTAKSSRKGGLSFSVREIVGFFTRRDAPEMGCDTWVHPAADRERSGRRPMDRQEKGILWIQSNHNPL